MKNNPVQVIVDRLMNQILDNANLSFKKAFIAGVPMDYIYDSEKEKMTIKTKYPIKVEGNNVYILASKEELAKGSDD